MRETAESMGFVFSRKGCPCNGSPDILTAKRDNKIYTMTIWQKRDYWKLAVSGMGIAWGNKNDMKIKIQEIWD